MSKISVIIPIYNAEKYLLRTIACLRAQTFRDFEVLLVNDGSSDGSAELCKAASEADPRFRYIYKENGGVSSARNLGIELSCGEYITFIDADDIIPENYLGELRCALLDAGADMSLCDVAVIDSGSEVNRFTCGDNNLVRNRALDLLLSRRGINSGPCAKLFRRSVINDLKFPPLKAYEDILFVADAMCRCKQVASTSGTEYRYIQNEGSAMSAFKKVPSEDIATATDLLLGLIEAEKDLDALCFYITASHLMQYVIPLLENEDERARGFIRSAKRVYRKYIKGILRCAAFPWKEKITYAMFAFGFVYHNKTITRMR